MLRRGTPGAARRRGLIGWVVLLVAAAALAVVVRGLATTRTPRRDPDQGPVIGSVDTWAAVPRSPAKVRGAA